MTLLLILWVLCAIGAAFIASTKNRSVTGFFFAGLFLGVIGLVWAAMAADGDSRDHERLSSRNW